MGAAVNPDRSEAGLPNEPATAPIFPRLTLFLDGVAHNTHLLAADLRRRGIELVGVTKALDGEPVVGQTMVTAGCAGLADSRLPALARLAGHTPVPLTLIRAPQADEVREAAQVADRVALCDVGTARALGTHRSGHPLALLLTVDLGDRREGVLPELAPQAANDLADVPGVALGGISVNFACLSGQLPSQALFREAEDVLAAVAARCAAEPLLSLGGTCCLQHLEGYRPRFRTEIRAGGGLLYGYDFVSAAPLSGLVRSDPVLSAVVLESLAKPPAPSGTAGLDAFGHAPDVSLPDAEAWYSLLALGRRDAQPESLRPLLAGVTIAGMTSDVTVLTSQSALTPGSTVDFAVDYEGLVRAVTSPFVARRFVSGTPATADHDR